MYLFLQNLMFLATTGGTGGAAGGNPFEKVSQPIIQLLELAVTPALGIVGAIGAIYCIILGAKLAKAEEPQDREKAKNSLENGGAVYEKGIKSGDFMVCG